ncbi:hypothetical protein RJ639_045898 [Escallonia herrerae]|uniref:Uncharacterized protein n=1 Tax=Escallonia herrerae TaxID=1293975 RepID=A0AA88WDU8_9ASTE|nr:hypothetical protein RJ639_045898 [Escallonia herrerae]
MAGDTVLIQDAMDEKSRNSLVTTIDNVSLEGLQQFACVGGDPIPNASLNSEETVSSNDLRNYTTTTLDTESERVVQDAMDAEMVERRCIVLARLLSTIKGADIIAVLKNGVIAEKGKHDLLMRKTDGAYASLIAIRTSSSKWRESSNMKKLLLNG